MLRFTRQNWSMEQPVTVSINEDDDRGTNWTIFITHTASGGDYVSQTAEQRVLVRDNDAGHQGTATISAVAMEVIEGEPAQFIVRLNPVPLVSIPSAAVNFTWTGNFDVRSFLIDAHHQTYDHGRTEAIFSVTTPNTLTGADGSVTATINHNDYNGYRLGSPASATVVIKNRSPSDRRPTVSIARLTNEVTEGDAATFRVTATPRPAATLPINLHVSGGGDFIAAGDLGQKVVDVGTGGTADYSVDTVTDIGHEPNGSVDVSLSPGDGYIVGTPAVASVVVNDNDQAPTAITLSVDADTRLNGTQTSLAENGGAKTVRVTAAITGNRRFGSPAVVKVKVGKSGDTATEGTDYANVVDRNLIIPALGRSAHVEFPIAPTDDNTDEGDETISIEGELTGVTFGQTSMTITDDDMATLSIADVTADEGASAAFTVTLSTPSAAEVKVTATTSVEDGDTASAADYTHKTQELTFAAGTTTATFSVALAADMLNELDETFTVTLSGASGATIEDATATGTINGADTLIGIANASAREGENLSFTLTRTGDTAGASTVAWTTGDDTTQGAARATAGADYTAVTQARTVTFAATETTKTVTVASLADALVEGEETFRVNLASPSGALLANDFATGTITEGTTGYSIADANATEGGSLSFTVTRSGLTSGVSSVRWNTADDTTDGARQATAGVDYTGTTSAQTLSFTAGDTAKTITVTTRQDLREEPDETFAVVLSNPNPSSGSALLRSTAIGTIENDDDVTPPSVAIGDVPAAINSRDPFTATFTFSEDVTGFTTDDVTVTGGAKGDVRGTGADYTLVVTPAGSADVVVTVTANSAADGFGNMGPASTVSATAVWDVTIPTVAIGGVPAKINSTAALNATLVFSEAVTGFVAGDVMVTGGMKGALSGIGTTYTMTVTPNGSQDVVVTVQANAALDRAGNAGPASAVLATADWDTASQAVTVTPSALRATEGSRANVTVRLTSAPASTATFEFANLVAERVTAVPARLTFNAANWEDPQPIELRFAHDDDETDEFDRVQGLVTVGGQSTNLGEVLTLHIIDDDKDAPAIQIFPQSGTAQNEGAQDRYRIRLSLQPTDDVIVTITGQAGTDVTLSRSSLTFTTLNWQNVQSVEVNTASDPDAVNDLVTLVHTASGGGYDGVTANHLVRILDTTPPGRLSIAPLSLSVAEGGSAEYSFSLAAEPTSPVTVTITGQSGTDLTLSRTVHTFNPTGANRWNTARRVTVTAGSDADAANDMVTLVHSAHQPGGNYHRVSGSVAVTVADDEQPDLEIADVPARINSRDPFTATFTFSEDVTGFTAGDIDVDGGVKGGFRGSGAAYTLIITPDGDEDVTVEVASDAATVVGGVNTGPADAVSATAVWDATAPTVAVADVPARINSRDPFTATFTFSEDVTGFEATDVTVSGGAKGDFEAVSATVYTLEVTPAGAANVVLTVAADAAADGAGNDGPDRPVSATATWDATPPTVEIGGLPAAINSTARLDVTFTFSENVSGFETADVTVTGGVRGTFASTSASVYTLQVTPNDGSDVTVEVRANAAIDEVGNTGPTAAVAATAAWTAGVTVAESGAGTEVTEADGTGNTDTYTLVLDAAPRADVTVTVTPAAGLLVDGPDAATTGAASETLVFTTTNWSQAQTVTVFGVDDAIDQGASRTLDIEHAAASDDDRYDEVGIADVEVTVTDDDMRGVSVDPATVTVRETDDAATGDDTENVAAYEVVLDSQPTAAVTVTITTPGNSPVTPDPATLTFTAANWDDPQEVEVTAVDDDIDNAGGRRTATLSHDVSGGDYGQPEDFDVTVTVTDDDTAGLALDPATLTVAEGASGSYTVALATKPSGTVTVTVTAPGGLRVDGPDAATAFTVGETLTFTTTNWSQAQTVRVQADDDDIDQGTGRSLSIAHAAAGADYATVSRALAVTVTDDDMRGVSVDPATVTVRETDDPDTDGNTENVAAYAVKLDSHGVPRPGGHGHRRRHAGGFGRSRNGDGARDRRSGHRRQHRERRGLRRQARQPADRHRDRDRDRARGRARDARQDRAHLHHDQLEHGAARHRHRPRRQRRQPRRQAHRDPVPRRQRRRLRRRRGLRRRSGSRRRRRRARRHRAVGGRRHR